MFCGIERQHSRKVRTRNCIREPPIWITLTVQRHSDLHLAFAASNDHRRSMMRKVRFYSQVFLVKPFTFSLYVIRETVPLVNSFVTIGVFFNNSKPVANKYTYHFSCMLRSPLFLTRWRCRVRHLAGAQVTPDSPGVPPLLLSGAVIRADTFICLTVCIQYRAAATQLMSSVRMAM